MLLPYATSSHASAGLQDTPCLFHEAYQREQRHMAFIHQDRQAYEVGCATYLAQAGIQEIFSSGLSSSN